MSLTTQRQTIIATARSIVDQAKAANRDLTPAEADQVQAAITHVEELDGKIKSGDVVRQVLALGGAGREFDPDRPSGIFNAEAKAGLLHAVKSMTTFRTEVDAKAALTTSAMLPTAGEYAEPGVNSIGVFPISSLFRQEAAPGPVIRYYRMGSGTAAVVAEGAAKPDAGVTITPVDLALSKLACLAQYSREMAEDASFLVSYLQLELAAAVAAAENTRILATFGAASGILTMTGATADVVDVVADAIAGQEAYSGKTPTAVIAHPTVVSAIRKAKASTAGSYMVPPTEPGPTQIHGVPIVSTPATAPATAWVVEQSGVTIYRRGPLTVEVGTNADDLSKNLQTMVAEERMGAAVTRPSCLTKLTLS